RGLEMLLRFHTLNQLPLKNRRSCSVVQNTFFINFYFVYIIGYCFNKDNLFMSLWLIVLGTATYSFLSDDMYIIFAILGGGCLLLTGILLNRKGIKNE